MNNRFENTERFKGWLSERLTSFDETNLDIYLEEVVRQYENTGTSRYELSARETKSGFPETIDFKTAVSFFDENGIEMSPDSPDLDNFAVCEVKFIF